MPLVPSVIAVMCATEVVGKSMSLWTGATEVAGKLGTVQHVMNFRVARNLDKQGNALNKAVTGLGTNMDQSKKIYWSASSRFRS